MNSSRFHRIHFERILSLCHTLAHRHFQWFTIRRRGSNESRWKINDARAYSSHSPFACIIQTPFSSTGCETIMANYINNVMESQVFKTTFFPLGQTVDVSARVTCYLQPLCEHILVESRWQKKRKKTTAVRFNRWSYNFDSRLKNEATKMPIWYQNERPANRVCVSVCARYATRARMDLQNLRRASESGEDNSHSSKALGGTFSTLQHYLD